MKRLKEFCVVVLTLSIALTSIIVTFGAENNLDICDHNYKYTKTVDDYFVYTCIECDDIEKRLVSDVNNMWNIEAVNQSVDMVEDGYLLDVVPDGIINAKDYAKIRHTYRYGY